MRKLILLISLLALMSCSAVEYKTWRMMELPFESRTDYSSTGADAVRFDVQFTHVRTGKILVRPAFWDGGNRFLVRFAPPLSGRWKWTTICYDDASLSSKDGSFHCVKYGGNLEIYKRGFVTVKPGNKYFTYADGTPFFYLGDTHWGMFTEEYDTPGHHAGETGAESHFKYIVDRRVQQGFTVYQSEPIGARFRIEDGTVDQEDIEGFRMADKYFEYIADAGLVHANAQFFFASAMSAALAADKSKLENISRYWVARYGAWPVMWTLAQEIDNDFYNERGDQRVYDHTCNPWVDVAEYMHRYDAYSNPLSGHQENVGHTSVTGAGWKADLAKGRSASVFQSEAVAKRTGHNWWAAQWSPYLLGPADPELVRDYLNTSRPAVNYEGRYCGLWTMDFGARAQGWISFLSGFCGYGYGAIDIWLYNSSYDIGQPSFDGVDTISVQDKLKPWAESVEYPSANQMKYLRGYFESFDWWNLHPVLADEPDFAATSTAHAYARTDSRHVFYFFDKSQQTGTVRNLKPSTAVAISWFNPRTGEESGPAVSNVSSDGTLELPLRPDSQDWVMTIQYK